MTGDSQASQDSAATTAASGNAMRFAVDGWEPPTAPAWNSRITWKSPPPWWTST